MVSFKRYAHRGALKEKVRRCTAVSIVAAFILFIASYRIFPIPFASYSDIPNSYYHTQNATLGFQKIFVLNTPARKDRLRNMNALARYHSLKMDFAKTFSQRESDALASTKGYLINGTHLACYLGHLNIYRQMVQRGVETALILEDDVDMEIDLRERHAGIMSEIHRRYGRDWDMLYLGHCVSDTGEPGLIKPTWFAKTGQYAASPQDRQAFLSRNVSLYLSEYPMCLHAYAVTRGFAKRLSVLLEERLQTVGQDIDLVIAVGVKFGFPTALGASPPYVVQVGRQELPSDLTSVRDGDTAQHLFKSTLYHLGLRTTDPHALAPFMDWGWFTVDPEKA